MALWWSDLRDDTGKSIHYAHEHVGTIENRSVMVTLMQVT